MTFSRSRIGLTFLILVAMTASRAKADLIVAGTTDLPGTAIMDLTLLPGTPFNMTASPIVLTGVSGDGTITLNRDAQIGTTINIATLAGGMFYGADPNLGTYRFGNVGTLTGADFSGVITNVVQNPLDPGYATGQPSSFQSGDFSFGGNSFGFEFLTGPAAGIILYTNPAVPFGFAATFLGLPPTADTTLTSTGTDALDVLFNGDVVAQTSNRRILLHPVPEPTSLVMLTMGAVGMLGYTRRRKAAKLS